MVCGIHRIRGGGQEIVLSKFKENPKRNSGTFVALAFLGLFIIVKHLLQVQYLLSCLLQMCETLFHSLEAAFAYLRTAVRLSPNSRLQDKICIFFQCFPVGCFFYSSDIVKPMTTCSL